MPQKTQSKYSFIPLHIYPFFQQIKYTAELQEEQEAAAADQDLAEDRPANQTAPRASGTRIESAAAAAAAADWQRASYRQQRRSRE
jgi:hypothetical protein